MVKLHEGGVYLVNGETLVPEAETAKVEQMTGKGSRKRRGEERYDRIWHHESPQPVR